MSKSFLSPPEITSAIISMGVARGNEKNIIKTLVSGFVAGMFIALAAICLLYTSQESYLL